MKVLRDKNDRTAIGIGLLTIVVALFLNGDLVGQAPPNDSHRVIAVDSVEMTVADIDRSRNFYTTILGFEQVSDCRIAATDRVRDSEMAQGDLHQVKLKLGEETLVLTEYLYEKGRSMPADSRGNDHWFQHIAIIVSDMDQAYSHLRQHKVKHASSGPQTLPEWNRNAAGIRAFYFRDPDGHFLEVLEFPSGKGDPKWQKPPDSLFLGIDHTAIVVADTESSLKFYQERLGMRIAGTSENYGVEQEHLNGVFGARLRITTLRGDEGPGIELLEYIFPTDGRPAPNDVRTNDILHWQVNVIADVSANSPFNQPTMIRDPDGHAIMLAPNR